MHDYQAQAQVTLATNFHGHKVAHVALLSALADFAGAAERLDVIKKALFYGRGDDIGPTRGVGCKLADAALISMAGGDSNHGLDDADLTLSEIILHGIIGKATESGELVEALLKSIRNETPIDRVNLIEEIGDGFWYDAVLLEAAFSSFSEAQQINIAKLRKRFPAGFTEYDANNRNLADERQILEAGSTDPNTTLPLVFAESAGLPPGAKAEVRAEFALRKAAEPVALNNGVVIPDTVGNDEASNETTGGQQFEFGGQH